MRSQTPDGPLTRAAPAWFTTALTGVALPILILLALSIASSPLAKAGGPVLTLGLMGVGIIAASIIGKFWIGISLALLNAACLLVLAFALGMPAPAHPFAIGLAMVIASGSFAARGTLFSKTLSAKGWLMALFVVAGEASVVLIVSTLPGVLPEWFLALVPVSGMGCICPEMEVTAFCYYAPMSMQEALTEGLLAGLCASTLTDVTQEDLLEWHGFGGGY